MSLLTRPGPAMALLAAGAILSTAAGLAVGERWLLPILNALPAWLVMAACLRQGRRRRAVGLMLWWALWLALSGIAAAIWLNGAAQAAVFNAATYRDEMLAWIRTGSGRESTPALFVPQHLIHAAIFCLLSLASAGALSLVMGSALLNYMSFYVGDLLLRCEGAASYPTALVAAWNPWSIVRVASFIVLGVVLAEPILSRSRGSLPPPPGRRRWLLAGAAGLGVDLALKSILAPMWPELLRGCLAD